MNPQFTLQDSALIFSESVISSQHANVMSKCTAEVLVPLSEPAPSVSVSTEMKGKNSHFRFIDVWN
jgi:hypothetical protein